jgi:hypothetical protein
MKPLQLLAVLLAIGCAQAPAQNNRAAPQPAAPAAGSNAETEANLDRFVLGVRLPGGAGALATYARSYAWQQREDGVRKVIAVYETLTGASPGRRWVAETELPAIMDGGCGLVSLSYDVATQRIEHVSCNGVA